MSVVLFSVGGLFALYEAYHKWHEIHEGHEDELLTSEWWWVPLVVLVAAIVMEGFSFRTAILESNKVKRRPVVVDVHPHARRRPSCRSCCSRTSLP